MNKCICEWCNNEQNKSGRGYCRRHYDQIRKYGYILDVRSRTDDNRIRIKDDYAEVIITDSRDNVQGFAKISLRDVDKIKGHHWSDNGNGYVRSFDGVTPIYLHRFIMECPNNKEVDHINHDKLDNRRENLRIVEHNVNTRNKVGKCIYKITGRYLSKPYRVKFTKDGKVFYCKYFRTYKEALIASNKVRKEFAEL